MQEEALSSDVRGADDREKALDGGSPLRVATDGACQHDASTHTLVCASPWTAITDGAIRAAEAAAAKLAAAWVASWEGDEATEPASSRISKQELRQLHKSLLLMALMHGKLRSGGSPSRAPSDVVIVLGAPSHRWEEECGARCFGYGASRLRVEDIVYTCLVLKRSRHLRAWRPRWAIVTSRYIMTFCVLGTLADAPTERLLLNDVTGLEQEGALVKLCVKRRSFNFRFQGHAIASRWVEAIAGTTC